MRLLAKFFADWETILYLKLWKKLWGGIYGFLFGWAYKNYGQGSYISPSASVRPKRRVMLGKNSLVCRGAVIWGELSAGDNFSLGPNSTVFGKVVIGNDVMIAPNVVIAGGSHGLQLDAGPMRLQRDTSDGVIIGDDVWIAANVVITDGVQVGSGAVIGAGSVVTGNVESNSIVVGNPAKLLRFRR